MPEIICDTCRNGAIHAYCDACMDEKLEKEYDQGKLDGIEEAGLAAEEEMKVDNN